MLLKAGTCVVLVLYSFLSVLLFVWGFSHLPLLCCAVGTAFLAVLTFLYLYGLNNENDWAMIPFVVAEVIVRIILGFVIGLFWIGYLLALFELISVNNPFEWLSESQFLFLLSLLATILFVFWIRIFFFFFQGYRRVKKANDQRRLDSESSENYYMRITTTSRPSKI